VSGTADRIDVQVTTSGVGPTSAHVVAPRVAFGMLQEPYIALLVGRSLRLGLARERAVELVSVLEAAIARYDEGQQSGTWDDSDILGRT